MSLFQSNLRTQIRNLPKILNSVKIIHCYSKLFTGVLSNLSYFRIHRYLETAWSQIEYIDTDRAREVLVEFLLLRDVRSALVFGIFSQSRLLFCLSHVDFFQCPYRLKVFASWRGGEEG